MKALTRISILAVATAALASLAASSGSSTPPGKNGLLLFQKQIGGWTQLFTMAADGSGLRQVTHGPHISEDSSWSPDGKTIAFSREFPTHASILLMRADGSALRTLTPNGLQTSPTFTPNGRWIVYSRVQAKDNSLWVMDVNGKHLRRLTRTPGTLSAPQFLPADESPTVSPDGKLVVFARELGDTRSALFVIGFDGRGLRRLTPWNTGAVGKLDWAPDGSRILFHTNDAQSEIHTILPDGTGLTTLTSGDRNYGSGSFSPDGTQILLIDNSSSDTDTQLYTMSASGGALTPVPNGHGVHRVSWGPAVG
jgi:Tol biopolymer transport system component